MKSFQKIIRLFLEFLKLGCFTFGGGWSIVAQMQRTYVEEKHEISGEELLDITSVGRSLPGTMIGNVAMLFGYHVAGIPGGIVCVLGLIIPPLVFLSVITFFYTAFRSNPWVAAGMTGIRASIVPILISAVMSMVKGAFRFPPCYLVTVICVVMYLGFNAGCVMLVAVGAVSGLIISEYYERKGIRL